MGFLDNSSITVDAILTKIGRKRISDGSFRVSKFSLSDEEIDYTLYDVTHPNGTDAYGTAIENINLLEAVSNRTGFNSHLVNASISGAKIKLASLNYPNLESGDNVTLKPSTEGAPAENYSFVVENTGIAAFQNPSGAGTGVYSATVASAAQATLIAQAFANPSPTATTNVRVTGLTSGLSAVITLTVKATPTSGNDALNPDNNVDTTTDTTTLGVGTTTTQQQALNIGGAGSSATNPYSDSRLKTNIEYVGLENNLKTYNFNYVWDSKKYKGVMAQDILKSHPNAVEVDKSSGYYRVNYDKLNVKFEEV